MFDSCGRMPIGVIAGSFSAIGDYEQCLAVKSPSSKQNQFVGQYCMAKMELPISTKFVETNDTIYAPVKYNRW